MPFDRSEPSGSRAPVPQRRDFSVFVREVIRFRDMDRQGHVNNAVYSTYFETGRVGVIYESQPGLQVPGATSVVGRIEIDFLKELRWPGEIEIGTAIGHISRSSYVFAQAIFQGEVCHAAARSTMVLMDNATRRSRVLPEDLIERLKVLVPTKRPGERQP